MPRARCFEHGFKGRVAAGEETLLGCFVARVFQFQGEHARRGFSGAFRVELERRGCAADVQLQHLSGRIEMRGQVLQYTAIVQASFAVLENCSAAANAVIFMGWVVVPLPGPPDPPDPPPPGPVPPPPPLLPLMTTCTALPTLPPRPSRMVTWTWYVPAAR